MVFHERGHEIKKRFLTQNDGNGDPQQTFRSLLRLSQHLLSFLQEIQRLLALAEVLLPLRSQRDPPRGAPQKRHAELGFQYRQPPAHRRDWHSQRACCARDALELGDLNEYQNVVEIRHGCILPFMERRLQRLLSNQS